MNTDIDASETASLDTHVLVYAKMPEDKPETVTTAQWTRFLSSLANTELRPGGTLCLGQNLWQIPSRSELCLLTKILHQAEGNGVRLRILFLDGLEGTPNWQEYPAPAKPPGEQSP